MAYDGCCRLSATAEIITFIAAVRAAHYGESYEEHQTLSIRCLGGTGGTAAAGGGEHQHRDGGGAEGAAGDRAVEGGGHCGVPGAERVVQERG